MEVLAFFDDDDEEEEEDDDDEWEDEVILDSFSTTLLLVFVPCVKEFSCFSDLLDEDFFFFFGDGTWSIPRRASAKLAPKPIKIIFLNIKQNFSILEKSTISL